MPEEEDLIRSIVSEGGLLLALLIYFNKVAGRSFPGGKLIAGAEEPLEVHAIFPREVLDRYPERDNEFVPDRLGNLTLLTRTDSEEIGATPASEYLPQLAPKDRSAHLIPEEPGLWSGGELQGVLRAARAGAGLDAARAAGWPGRGMNEPDPAGPPEDEPGRRHRAGTDRPQPADRRLRRGPAAAGGRAADGGAVHLLRPLRAGHAAAGAGIRRAAAPAHQPGHGDLPVPGRHVPPGQPGFAAADRARGHQLDDRRAGASCIRSGRRPTSGPLARRRTACSCGWRCPGRREESDPSFRHYPAESLPSVDVEGVAVRVMVGAAFGLTSPVAVLSPTLYAEIKLPPGRRVELPAEPRAARPSTSSTARSPRRGAGRAPAAGRVPPERAPGAAADGPRGAHLVLHRGRSPGRPPPHLVELRLQLARSASSRPRPTGRPMRIGIVPGDDQEFIPLPDR